jgi:hypothetical protein
MNLTSSRIGFINRIAVEREAIRQRTPSSFAKSSCKDCHGRGIVRFALHREQAVSKERGIQTRISNDVSQPCRCAKRRFEKAKANNEILPLPFHWDDILWV